MSVQGILNKSKNGAIDALLSPQRSMWQRKEVSISFDGAEYTVRCKQKASFSQKWLDALYLPFRENALIAILSLPFQLVSAGLYAITTICLALPFSIKAAIKWLTISGNEKTKAYQEIIESSLQYHKLSSRLHQTHKEIDKLKARIDETQKEILLLEKEKQSLPINELQRLHSFSIYKRALEFSLKELRGTLNEDEIEEAKGRLIELIEKYHSKYGQGNNITINVIS